MSVSHVTVLYEDKMAAGANGRYPFHDLVLRMVEDEIDGQTWVLSSQVSSNPRNGVEKLLADLPRTSLIAGAGRLMLLVDEDHIREKLKLTHQASESQILAALRQLSDTPEKVECFLLRPNLEGVLRAIQQCDGSLLPSVMEQALKKKLTRRDMIFREARKESRRKLRDCVQQQQPGLAQLVAALCRELTPKHNPNEQ